MTRQADRRAHLDLQINLLAEQESTATLRAVHGMAHHLGVDPAMYLTDASLAEETDIEHLASRMDEAMPCVPGRRPLILPGQAAWSRPSGLALSKRAELREWRYGGNEVAIAPRRLRDISIVPAR